MSTRREAAFTLAFGAYCGGLVAIFTLTAWAFLLMVIALVVMVWGAGR